MHRIEAATGQADALAVMHQQLARPCTTPDFASLV
jgi:hypothetical protein